MSDVQPKMEDVLEYTKSCLSEDVAKAHDRGGRYYSVSVQQAEEILGLKEQIKELQVALEVLRDAH